MLKAYKYRIYPNREQQVLLSKTFGCCRKIYNWALDFKNKRYTQYQQNVNRFELDKMLTFLKSTEENSYLNEVGAQTLQRELANLEIAFTNFFKNNKDYPKFKNKYDYQSAQFPQGVKIDFKSQKVFIPKLKNTIVKIDRKFTGDIRTCTVSRTTTNKYFISILVEDGIELPIKKEVKEETSTGIDVGLKSFLVDSNGLEVENPKFYRNSEKRIKCLQRRLSRKVKESKNRRKAQLKLALKHEYVANQRKDFLQKLTTNIIKNQDTIFVEDLNVKGMLKNHNLAKSISDASWSEFFRQLKYKSEWLGKNIIEIGRFEPSSKMCSCGVINKELKLEDREWTCKSCGAVHHRDLLAANNIKKFGLMKLNYYTPRDTGGESVELSTKVGAMKQKPSKAKLA